MAHMSVFLTCIISDSDFLKAALSASETSEQPLPPPLDIIMIFKNCSHHGLQQAFVGGGNSMGCEVVVALKKSVLEQFIVHASI